MIKHLKNIDILLIVTTIYIVLPIAVFLISWTKLIFSSISILLLFIFFIKNRNTYIKKEKYYIINWKNVLLIVITLVLLFLWICDSGIGGYARQNWDYEKHNELIHDLYYQQWPVQYEGSGTLIYYVAFYLIPVGLAKIIGYEFINILFFLMLYAGVLIAYFWICRYLKRVSVIPIIILIFWGGFDYLGRVIIHHDILPFGNPYFYRWTTWIKITFLDGLQYPSITSHLYFAPQITISGIIVPIVIMYYIKNRQISQIPYLLVTCTFLWSPWIFIGMIPFLFYYLIYGIRKIKKFWPAINLLTMITCFYIFSLLAIYLISNSQATQDFRLLTQYINNLDDVLVLLLFYILEFGIVFVYILLFRNKSNNFVPAWISFVSLILISFICIGKYDDFGMRVPLPSLVILYLYFTNIVLDSIYNIKGKTKVIRIILAIIIVLNMCPTGLNHFVWTFRSPIIDNSNLYTNSLNDDELAYQYISKDNNNLFNDTIIK